MHKSLVFSLIVVCTLLGAMPARAQSEYEPYAFTTLAGLPPGKADGQGAAARFQSPQGMATDSAGNLFVADVTNHSVRKVSPNGQVSTFAGRTGVSGYVDGPGNVARFYYPEGIAIDSSGNLWVADAGNGAIRKITPAGVVSTFVGGTVGTGNELGFSG